MTGPGEELLEGMKNALAYAREQPVAGARETNVEVPEIDLRAIRKRLGPGTRKNKSSHLASSFRQSSADPGSQNPQQKPGGQGWVVKGREPGSREGGAANKATPPVLLPRIDQISPKSEHDLGTI